MKKILFVCSANLQRSITAEKYFSEKYPSILFLSAGTNHKICLEEGSTPLEQKQLLWADLILVMEEKHRDFIQKLTGEETLGKTHILEIPDEFEYYQKELIELLEEKATPFLSL